MTKYLWIGVIALGGTLTGQAATFELLDSQASVGIGACKTQGNRISNFETGEGFTSYSDSVGRDPSAMAARSKSHA